MKKKDKNVTEGIPPKEDYNSGSGAFNQGIEQDTTYDNGTPISDEEKKTGHIPGFGREDNDAKDGNTGTNDVGGDK